MSKKDVDVLKIEFFDGHEEIDPNAYYWDYVNLAVKLMINGKDLMDYIAEETKEKTDHAVWYAHGKAEWVLSDLPVQPGEVNDMFMPFTCPSCGEPGCCRFDGRIRCDEQYVYWYDFQSMEMPKSEVAFCFARTQYEKVVQAAQKELNSKLQLQYVQSIWDAFKENNREYFEETDMDMFLQRQDVYECIWDYYEEKDKWDTAPLLYKLEEMYGTVDHFLCPVCGLHDFGYVGTYEICPHCNWENDELQFDEPDLWGGPNQSCLNTYRAWWQEKLAGHSNHKYAEQWEKEQRDKAEMEELLQRFAHCFEAEK